MFDVFDKPLTKQNGMDFAEYNMLTNNNYNAAQRKYKTGGCDCLTTVIVAIVVLIFIAFPQQLYDTDLYETKGSNWSKTSSPF